MERTFLPVSQANRMDIEETFQALSSSREGLSTQEAQRRLPLCGSNMLEKVDDESLILKFLGQFKEPLILLLLGSALVSIIMGEIADALGIFIAVTIVNLVGFYQEYKSEKSVEALRNLTAHFSSVLRDGSLQTISSQDLVPGDVIPLESGVRVPADLRLFEAADIQLDESILTGEPDPCEKTSETMEENQQDNIVFMGTVVVHGRGKGIVVATGNNTSLGKISNLIQEMADVRTPLQEKMDEIGKNLSILAFAIVGFIFIVGVIQKKDWLDMFTIGVSLAVAAIPEGLPIVVTVTLALGVTRMAKRKAIVRKLPAVEALGATTVICSDKTGTLTKNQMTVTSIFTDQDYTVSGIGYQPQGEFYCDGQVINVNQHRHLLELLTSAMLCNNAHFDHHILIGQPTEGAILIAGQKASLEDARGKLARVEEIPFSPKSKIMFVAYESGDSKNVWYHVKGATEQVLSQCKYIYQNGQSVPLTERHLSDILQKSDYYGEASLRVVAVARGKQKDNLMFLGLIGISDPPKEGVDIAVRTAKQSGVKVVMLTGDSKATAVAIAKQLGIADDDSLAFSSDELIGSDPQQLASIVDHVSVFYRVSPEHKMNIVKAFQNRGHIVAMTGDGVNDAPALKISNIGIAMGQGTDAAKEAAKMILVDDNLSTIIAAIEEGKSIYLNIKNFLRFQLTTSIATLSMVAASTLFGLPLPLNPIQILWINIIMDGPPAQSLGLEPLDKSVVYQPPRKPKDPVFTKEMIVSIASTALVMVLGTLLTFYFELLSHQHTGVDPVQRATTVSFTTFVMFQMFNAMNCRSETLSMFKIGFFKNKFFVFAVAGSILMQLAAIYVPIFQMLFETVSLSFADLFYSTAVASSVFIIDEIRKALGSRTRLRNEPVLPL